MPARRPKFSVQDVIINTWSHFKWPSFRTCISCCNILIITFNKIPAIKVHADANVFQKFCPVMISKYNDMYSHYYLFLFILETQTRVYRSIQRMLKLYYNDQKICVLVDTEWNQFKIKFIFKNFKVKLLWNVSYFKIHPSCPLKLCCSKLRLYWISTSKVTFFTCSLKEHVCHLQIHVTRLLET